MVLRSRLPHCIVVEGMDSPQQRREEQLCAHYDFVRTLEQSQRGYADHKQWNEDNSIWKSAEGDKNKEDDNEIEDADKDEDDEMEGTKKSKGDN